MCDAFDVFEFQACHFAYKMDAYKLRHPIFQINPQDYARYSTKRYEIANSFPDYYIAAEDQDYDLILDATILILKNLATNYPAYFQLQLDQDGFIWHNHLLNSVNTYSFVEKLRANCAINLMSWIGLQTPDDLLILQSSEIEKPNLVAGHLCFASGWSLVDKLGKNILDIHDAVPGLNEAIGQSMDNLMQRLKLDVPVERWNWTVHDNDCLDQSPRAWVARGNSSCQITSNNAGLCCFLRVERQRLVRLPITSGILFVIQTSVSPLKSFITDQHQLSALLTNLITMPSEVRIYKRMDHYYDALITYLQNAQSKSNDQVV